MLQRSKECGKWRSRPSFFVIEVLSAAINFFRLTNIRLAVARKLHSFSGCENWLRSWHFCTGPCPKRSWRPHQASALLAQCQKGNGAALLCQKRCHSWAPAEIKPCAMRRNTITHWQIPLFWIINKIYNLSCLWLNSLAFKFYFSQKLTKVTKAKTSLKKYLFANLKNTK